MQKFIKNTVIFGLLSLVVSFVLPATIFAHVVVTPAQVITASRNTFAVSVPNEHDTPVVNVRLIIPEGLSSVRPYAKAGWTVDVKKSGEGENISATEITWTGGQVPVSLKDDFLFSAKVPGETTELKWKAYETYQDGTVVGWEQEPNDAADNKPYSVTKVVSQPDTQIALNEAQETAKKADQKASRALSLATIAFVLGIVGIYYVTRAQKRR